MTFAVAKIVAGKVLSVTQSPFSISTSASIQANLCLRVNARSAARFASR
jgi:hypothetical protein